MNMASALHDKEINGNRVAGLSPAGFETVGIADSLQSRDCCLDLTEFSPRTRKVIAGLFDHAGLTDIMDIKNPLDLTPAAPDRVYTGAVKAMLADDAIDAVVVSLGSIAPVTSDTPAPVPEGFVSGPDSLSALLPGIVRAAEKPVVVFNDAGRAHEPINNQLRDQGIPVFRSCHQAMGLLARYTAYRLRLNDLRRSSDA